MKNSQMEMIIANIFAAAGLVIYGSATWAAVLAVAWLVSYLISKMREQP